MPTAEQLREEIIACLRAGSKGWTGCQAGMSAPAKWLVSAARGQRPESVVMVDFGVKFGRDLELSHTARQALNVLRAQLAGERDWKASQDRDVVDAFPASELLVVLGDVEPFPWKERWIAAGGRLVDDRAIAPKGDPIWARFSEFGRPHPPFDWLTTLDWEDVNRSEAERLGVIPAFKRPAGSGCVTAIVIAIAATSAITAAIMLA